MLNLRVAIWTIGLGFVGYSLASRSAHSPWDSVVVLGTIAGAAAGFGVGTVISWLFRRMRS